MNNDYLNNSMTAQRLNELAKKYNFVNYMPGQSFDSVKENMSAEDYETSQKLLNYYTNQQNLTDNYNNDVQNVDKNRDRYLQENAISKEMTMKYLPEYLKLQGMGGLGVSQSAIISANNDFRNARNNINSDTESQKADLLKNYRANMGNLDTGATTETDSIREKYEDIRKEEAQNIYNNFVNKIDYGEFNTSEELEESYNQIKNKLDDSQKSILEDKINYYKNNLEQKQIDLEYQEQQDQITKETKEQTEKDARVVEGKEFVSYGGKEYKLTTQLNSGSNEIAHNNSFKEKLKELGFSNPYDENIPNGTTFEIKCDSSGADEFDFVKDVVGTGLNPWRNINNIWGAITGSDAGGYSSFSNFKKNVTYYNGEWYISEKQ